MTVKTTFSFTELNQIVSHYALGTLLQFEPAARGTVQTNYFLYTTRGKVVFRYYENRSAESVLFEVDLLNYLKTHHYPCPTPFPNHQGHFVETIYQKPYVLFEYVPGQHVENPTNYQKNQLIQQAAELQRITQSYQPAYLSHRWNYDVHLCRSLARAEAEKINTTDAFRKFTWVAHALDALSLPASHPKGICHCDFHFSNVLFQGDRFAALLDFDDANYTFLQFDLVGLIESWAWSHTAKKLNLADARQVVEAYSTYRPLSEQEQYHLFDVYKLSILFDCVWFFHRGSAADFYEKRKIDWLNSLSRSQFMMALFG